MLNLLALFPRQLWERKVSPARRHSIRALKKVAHLEMTGQGWGGYNEEKTVNENIDRLMPNCDAVIWYKPLGQENRFESLKGCRDVRVPTVLRFNEAWWSDRLAAKEVEETRSSIVVIHHENDRHQFDGVDAKVVHIPHGADREVFFGKKPHSERGIDFLLTGVQSKEIYPLRERFANLIRSGKIKGEIRRHPGYRKSNLKECDDEVQNYAEHLGDAKISLVCSSRYGYPLAKYVESAMSGCLVLGDMPEKPPVHFENFVAPVTNEMSDGTLVKIMKEWIENDKAREQTAIRGQRIASKEFSQERYAERLVKTIKEYIDASSKI